MQDYKLALAKAVKDARTKRGLSQDVNFLIFSHSKPHYSL